MKNRICFTFFFVLPLFISAQNHPVYLSLEGGGNGIIASGNIGKPLFYHARYKVIIQTGLGWTPAIAKSESPFNIPLQLSFNFGEKGSFMEAGVGTTLVLKSKLHKPHYDEAGSELYISPIIGFRYESDNWFARVYACPLYHLSGEHIQDPVTKDFIKFGIGIGAIL